MAKIRWIILCVYIKGMTISHSRVISNGTIIVPTMTLEKLKQGYLICNCREFITANEKLHYHPPLSVLSIFSSEYAAQNYTSFLNHQYFL